MPNQYQQLFDQTYPTIDSNDYGKLVYALQAVFEAAGFDITGQELAGAQHNYIVGSIGQTDLALIARSFIGWIRPAQMPLDYTTLSVAEGHTPYSLHNLSRQPQISGYTLAGWQGDVDAVLKKGQIRRKTKKYEAFIKEKAPRVLEPFRQAAQAILEQHRAKVERARAELEQENSQAQSQADHLRRTAYIVEAFCAVASLEDERGVAMALREKAGRIEAGIASRRKHIEHILADSQAYTVEDVVSGSIEHQPDLKALWEAAIQQHGDTPQKGN